jgi:hypothetical protein
MKKKIKKIIIKIDRYLDSVIPRWFTFFSLIILIQSLAYGTPDFKEFEIIFQSISKGLNNYNLIIVLLIIFLLETSIYNLIEFLNKYFNKRPFTKKDYVLAKKQGYNLNKLEDYNMYYSLGEEDE